jgi:hypothetical protein
MVGHVRIARVLSDPNGVCGLSQPVPDEIWWSHAGLHREVRHAMTLSCYWTMALRKWTRAPVLHRVIRICSPVARRLRHARDVLNEIGETKGTCTPTAAFTEPSANSHTMVNIENENAEMDPAAGAAPASARLQGGCITDLPSRNVIGGSRRACSPSRECGTIRFRNGPGALVRFGFQKKLVPRHGNAPCSAG